MKKRTAPPFESSLAEGLRRFPGRVLGYCYVNPGWPREALAEIRQIAGAGGRTRSKRQATPLGSFADFRREAIGENRLGLLRNLGWVCCSP